MGSVVASEQKPRPTYGLTWLAAGVGLATFMVGIVMLSLVFTWARYTFASIDEQFAKVRAVAAERSPAPASAQRNSAAKSGNSAPAGQPSKGNTTVEARPGGPSVGTIAAALAVKLLGLLVLGALAGMVAGRGANMVAAALRPPPVSG